MRAPGRKDHQQTHCRTVHEGLKPFHCDKCDARFGRKDVVQTHCRTLHEELR